MNRNIFWSLLRIVGALLGLTFAYFVISGFANMTFQPDRFHPPQTLDQMMFGN